MPPGWEPSSSSHPPAQHPHYTENLLDPFKQTNRKFCMGAVVGGIRLKRLLELFSTIWNGESVVFRTIPASVFKMARWGIISFSFIKFGLMAYEILSKMAVPSQLSHELGAGFSKWTVSETTEFWFLVNPLRNHYQWQPKSTQIKLKLIVACGSEMSTAISSTELFGRFFSVRECHGEWCLKRQSRECFTVLSVSDCVRQNWFLTLGKMSC